jgi:hypothetical protein
MRHYGGVRVGAALERGDDDFDGGVGGGEGGEGVFEEGVHALGGAGPVAVGEGEGFAGEDVVCYAVLGVMLEGVNGGSEGRN